MRSRTIRIACAGVAGLGLAALWPGRAGQDISQHAGVPPAGAKFAAKPAKAGNHPPAQLLGGSKGVRWLDPHDMGAAIGAPVDLRAASDAIALASHGDRTQTDPTSTATAYAPSSGLIDLGGSEPETPAPVSRVQTPDVTFDAAIAQAAIKAYRTGDVAKGDEEARKIADETGRLTLEWTALRLQPQISGFARISAFLDAHPDWAGAPSMRRRAEQALFSDKKRLAPAKAYFADRKPASTPGKLTLARVLLADGRKPDAAALVSEVWRTEELGGSLEALVQKEFGELLTPADHKFRSDRFFYKEKDAASLRAASFAGADVTALARARAAVLAGAKADKLIAAVPKALQGDPSLAYATVNRLRHDNKIPEAGQAMLAIIRDPAALVDGDAWWVERRLLARKLVDVGDAKTGYRIAAEHAAQSAESRIDAEFHAGWIALRFLDDVATAQTHFATAMRIAETPMSKSRFAYWIARAHEAAGEPDKASASYRQAAASPATFYGQLARARLGLEETTLRMPERIALGRDRNGAIRVAEALQALGESELALGLAAEAARTLDDESQLAALAQVMVDARSARGALMVGKLAGQRGFALDAAAFPTFGIPAFEPATNSAETPLVYAIARQESAFQTNAVSSAGARGLMQMIASTARRTAQRVGVAFDPNRMTTDPAFNARLGAAHLGDLLTENNGSLILTFAAYNAGGKRVKEWIAAYGDPRKADVDPIDWIERIPFTETRNYVQRVAENLEMYRAQFGANAPRLADKDLRVLAARF